MWVENQLYENHTPTEEVEENHKKVRFHHL